jgi:hypothetical protein
VFWSWIGSHSKAREKENPKAIENLCLSLNIGEDGIQLMLHFTCSEIISQIISQDKNYFNKSEDIHVSIRNLSIAIYVKAIC